MAVVKRRVGASTVRITSGRRPSVGIGDRFETEVEGRVTALAASTGNLFVGTARGVVVRLETQTGRQCARATFGTSIAKLSVRGAELRVTAAGETHVCKASTLRRAKT